MIGFHCTKMPLKSAFQAHPAVRNGGLVGMQDY
jgi:hypothetical protein